MNTLPKQAEEGLTRAIQRLTFLAERAERQGKKKRATELRKRMLYLCEMQ